MSLFAKELARRQPDSGRRRWLFVSYDQLSDEIGPRVFRELNLIEQWGSGIPRIFREARELGLPELEIMEVGMRVRVVVRLSEQIKVGKAARPTHSGEESGA